MGVLHNGRKKTKSDSIATILCEEAAEFAKDGWSEATWQMEILTKKAGSIYILNTRIAQAVLTENSSLTTKDCKFMMSEEGRNRIAKNAL